jgi:hypothetical protein
MTPDKTEIRAMASAANGTSIGGVTLGRELGHGGMAVVYEGMDLGFSPPRQVAVKLMAPNLSADAEFRMRFEREASLVAGFRHDNIVHVFASGDAGGAKYIVMEYLPGGTLGSKLAKGALPPAEAIAAGVVLADALAYSHARGVVHRDFKPGNVLFAAEGKPVLSDFGVAKTSSTIQADLTQHAAVIGAPRYMAPEQERADPVTDRADVYSFGLTLFEMLTGQLPPARERVLRFVDDGKEIKASLRNLPPDVADLVCRCLLFDPEARPSARNCADALSALSLTAAAPAARPAAPGRRRRNLAVAAAALGALIGAGVLAWPALEARLPQSAANQRVRAGALESKQALGALLADLDARREQMAQRLRDSDAAVERLKARVAGATSESARRTLEKELADAQSAAADAKQVLEVAETQVISPRTLAVIRAEQASEDDGKAWRDAGERARTLIKKIDDLEPAVSAQRQFSQLEQKVSAIIGNNGGASQVVLVTSEGLARQASQALSMGDSVRARSLFAAATLDLKSRAQTFLDQVIANYGIIARQKMAANDLEMARSAIDRAKSLKALQSEL